MNMIIYSVATVNIIDSALWEKLKANKIECHSEKTSKRLFAYGSDQPIQWAGVFSTCVAYWGQGEHPDRIMCAERQGTSTLGKKTQQCSWAC